MLGKKLEGAPLPEKCCVLADQGCSGAKTDLCLDLVSQEWYEEHSRKEESQAPLQESASASTSSLKPLSLRQRSQTVI